MALDKRVNFIQTGMNKLLRKRKSMSFLRTHRTLPPYTAMQLSPWLLVGFALILGLAISFWAVKNARLERENMSRVLLERSGALMWAMEGGARAGMGAQGASYLQHMLEETARQKDIKYIAIINRNGDILLHSDRRQIGGSLDDLDADLAIEESGASIHWRMLRQKGEGSTFQAYKPFMPMPGFSEHMGGHGRKHMGMRHRIGKNWFFRGMAPEEAPPGPSAGESGAAPSVGGGDAPRVPPAFASGGHMIVVALDMAPFEKALSAGESSIVFTAFLVGMLGVGGFISLFWAQSYKFSRRLLLDASAVADKVISSLPLGLLILDAKGKVVEANSVAEALLDYPEKKLLGLRAKEIQGLDWPQLEARVEKGETVLEEEHTLLLPDPDAPGEKRTAPVSVSAAKVLNDEGESLGLVFLLRDLREVKRLQKELRRSERLSTLGNMAARVAHEIRNPLSSIKGFATYLGSRHAGREDAEAAGAMIGEVDRLNRVVSELLDFARPSNLTVAPKDIVDILRRAIRLAETDAASKGVTVKLDLSAVPPDCRLLAAVDEERLTQALLNLFINAVQATDKGGSVTVAPFPVRGNRLGVRVSDTGCGMSEALRAQIFNPYFTTKASGTGLGLAIVQKIVEDHNGEIRVESVEGQGTEISLLLPAADASGQDGPSCGGESLFYAEQ